MASRRMGVKITSQDIPGFIFLFILIGLEIRTSLQQHCPQAQPVLVAEAGHALIGTVYTCFQTERHPLCLLECEQSESCMSLNYYERTSTCCLSTQTKESRPERYEQRRDCIYFKNPSGRIPATFIGMKAFPAKSCLDILVSGGSIGTGVYWLDPENKGNPIKVYCDMERDGGGWTTVKKTVLQTTSSPIRIPNERFEDYHVIEEYHNNDVNVIPTAKAMSSIIQLLGFDQIHFYCHKKSVGRVVSIMIKNDTAAQQVVRFFTEDFGFPNACGSFERLPEDSSIMVNACEKWGKNKSDGTEINKWGSLKFKGPKRLVSRPFAMEGNDKHAFGIYNNAGFYLMCDDSEDAVSPYNSGDILQISVR
ncbi:uncharacterized protein LOC116294959 isoform X2 [Actinia tenebrosa]|uniref:Uncharacterized protein LOC116294959 isoform X2 n=1 Tax=Actinia tenebrosa TaxID=6105 RepID=A0A6P8I0W2_ACTTE|nr:uncharacterized protein LOC116294959 isoform X2 [Actinia tenebrosa]